MEAMSTMRAGFAFGLAVSAFAATAAAAPPDMATVPSAGNGEFAVEGSAATARGDGARLVACGAVLVSATDGSRAAVSCKDGARVELTSGAFQVGVGAAGAAIRIGGATLRASSVRLWAARAGARWLVRFEPDGELGSVVIEGDGTAATAAEGVAPDRSSLVPGEVHAFEGATPAPGPVEAASSAALREAATRLAPREAPRKPLVPRRVEGADDFKTGTTAAAAGGGEIELEEIEVEAGCIEVCVD
jgi:hypothetical protein